MERDSNIITVLLLLLFQMNIHSFIHVIEFIGDSFVSFLLYTANRCLACPASTSGLLYLYLYHVPPGPLNDMAMQVFLGFHPFPDLPRGCLWAMHLCSSVLAVDNLTSQIYTGMDKISLDTSSGSLFVFHSVHVERNCDCYLNIVVPLDCMC